MNNFLTCLFTVFPLLLLGCGEEASQEPAKSPKVVEETTTMTDPRDGQTYAIVAIGKQVWMAENFRYDIEGSMLNPNNPSPKYGRLYNGIAAQKACPNGWHLPTDSEWNELEMTLGMPETEISIIGWRGHHASQLKSTDGWSQGGDGTNRSGFNILPSGFYFPAQASSDDGPGALDGLGISSGFWGMDANGKMWVRFVAAPREGINRMEGDQSDGFMHSCRYIKD